MSAGEGLDGAYGLERATIESFRLLGHAVVRGLATPSSVATVKPLIDEATEARRWDRRPLEQRDTYGRAFVQAANVHQHHRDIADFVLSKRFAKVAAELMGVPGVRLYHDQALYKEPGGGFTPWHQDQVYWPLETDDTVTMWMPLVRVPAEVGGMDFVDETWTRRNLSDLVIGDSSHAHFEDMIRQNDWSTSTYGPFEPGDATFHRGWTLHSAPANETDQMRSVITVIYYADGTKIGADDHPARQLDLALWLGGAKPGELADRNPLLWHESWSG